MNPQQVKEFLLELQELIVGRLEQVDGQPFRSDAWQRPEGGGGISRLIEEGNVLERGGVNFSHVLGSRLPPSATAQRPELAGRRWEAMGVSLVMHPRNPYAPTSHMNVRFFCAYPNEAGGAPIWWFGGGMDLTPYYGFEEDARHFHATCRKALEPFGAAYYPRYKKWCDDYFFLRHRNEPRGVGGVFFDDFNAPLGDAGQSFVPGPQPGLPTQEPPAEGHFAIPSPPGRRWPGGPDEGETARFRGTIRGHEAGQSHPNPLPQGEGDAAAFHHCFNLTESVGDHFLPAYVPILERRAGLPYGERERDFQAHRRGRYVEFNLVWDRGTLFGLQSGGRTESILMSLPPIVKWRYDWHPDPGTPEARLYTDFLKPRDWLA